MEEESGGERIWSVREDITLLSHKLLYQFYIVSMFYNVSYTTLHPKHKLYNPRLNNFEPLTQTK